MYSRQILGLDEARTIVEAILAEAAKDPDNPVAIAVVDSLGDLVYCARQEKGRPHFVRLAIRKAYTAANMRRDTIGIHEQFKGAANWYTSLGDWGDPNLIPLPGGVCIRLSDGTIVGAIGVSGRGSSRHKVWDVPLAELGLKALPF